MTSFVSVSGSVAREQPQLYSEDMSLLELSHSQTRQTFEGGKGAQQQNNTNHNNNTNDDDCKMDNIH